MAEFRIRNKQLVRSFKKRIYLYYIIDRVIKIAAFLKLRKSKRKETELSFLKIHKTLSLQH